MSTDTARPVRIAVDIGGTFTDLQILDAREGIARAWKTPTTPEDPSIGLLRGVGEAAERFGFALADVGLLLHGTTIATNAVLERKLARGVLLSTAGFEDVLEINRHVRRDIYGLAPDPFPVLVPRDRRLGVPERMRADGSAELPLDESAIPALLDRIAALGAECIAVSLLHAYANPAHEQRVAAMIRAARPDLPVSLSSDISPEIREYERTSTTVLNALLVPVVKAYLDRLEAKLGEGGFHPLVFLVQSNGGVCSLNVAAEQPARLLLSGPSGGTLAAGRLAGLLARPTWSRWIWAARRMTCRWCRTDAFPSSRRARSIASRCACRWSRCAPSAPAAVRSARSMRVGGSRLGRAAPARGRGRWLMGAAGRNRP